MPQRMVPNRNQQTILPSLQCWNIYRPVKHNRMPKLSTKHIYQHHRIVRRLYHVRSLPNRQSLGPRCLVVFSMRPGPIHGAPKRGWFFHHQNLHHLPGRLDQRVRGNEMRRMHPRKICPWTCVCFVRCWNVRQTKFDSTRSYFCCCSLRRLPTRNVFVGKRGGQRH